MTNKVLTTEEILAQFRAGYKDLELVYGDWKVPLRILDADEENKIISKVKQDLAKTPNQQAREQAEPLAVMKAILFQSAFIDGSPGMTTLFLDALSSTEVEKLYDQYLDKCHQVNPQIEDLSMEEVAGLLADIKKNSVKRRDLSSRQLKGIGTYFLEIILPMAKEHGSN